MASSSQPDWYIEGKRRGFRHPCPICFATGKKLGTLGYCGEYLHLAPGNCWHCQGTGDESAVTRRNGARPIY